MLLEECEVRIVVRAGAHFLVKGAGFLADSQHVLTCAHVVALALGIAATAETCPDQPVELDFPQVAREKWLIARVVQWKKAQQNALGEPEFVGDIAVLRLEPEHAAPPGVQVAQLLTVDDHRDHRFRARGFPDRFDNGQEAKGTLSGRVGDWVQMDNNADNFRVQQGFSGGAVWDEVVKGIVGMVVAEATDVQSRVGWMIPAWVLMKAWPPLFLEELEADNASRRYAAAQALCALKDPATAPGINRHLKSEPDPTTRYWLYYALGRIGEKLAFDALQQAKTTEQDPFAQQGIDAGLKELEGN